MIWMEYLVQKGSDPFFHVLSIATVFYAE